MENYTIRDNDIHPTAILNNVKIEGTGNYIGPYCVIENAIIGSNNRFEAHCCIGSVMPEPYVPSRIITKIELVIIGDNNNFKEFVTIKSGIVTNTIIGNYNLFMNYAHIAHDCVVGDEIVIYNNVQVSAHTYISSFSEIGLSAAIHSFSFLGEGCIIGMGAVIPKNKRILPYKVYVGVPCKELKDNIQLIKKLNKPDLEIIELRKAYNTEFNNKVLK